VIGSTRQVAVWAYGAPADPRKGFDGLSALGSQGLGRDPLSGDCAGPPGRPRSRNWRS
jgi:transposase